MLLISGCSTLGLSEDGQMQYRVAMSQEPEAAALAAATGVQAVEDDFMAQPGCALVVTDAGPSINVQEQRRFKVQSCLKNSELWLLGVARLRKRMNCERE